MESIKIAIVGVGNCASSLVQGIEYYRDKLPEDAIGLMHWEIGSYRPFDIEVVAAFDIDLRKVGRTSPRRSSSPRTARPSSAATFPRRESE